MEKLNFEDLPSTKTPINATNLNLVQDYMENSFKNEKTTSTQDTYSCNYINDVIPTMETGTVKLTGTSNNWAWAHITYTEEYDEAPYVFTQINDNKSTQISTIVINRTTTGCDVGIYNHNYTRTINYLVIKK